MSKRPRIVTSLPGYSVIGGGDGADGDGGAGGDGDDEDTMRITPLGSGAEVGRSCHVITYRGRSVMLDCGLHPGRSGMDALPFLDSDAVDLASVECILVSHFHIDHVAALPYLTERTAFKGRVFMTHPTKAVMRMLIADYLRILPLAAGAGADGGDGDSSKAALFDEVRWSSAASEHTLESPPTTTRRQRLCPPESKTINDNNDIRTTTKKTHRANRRPLSGDAPIFQTSNPAQRECSRCLVLPVFK